MKIPLRLLPCVAEIAVRLLAVETALRFMRPCPLIAWLGRGRRRHRSLVELSPLVLGLERRLFGGASCLRGALTIFWMMGPNAKLHLGIRTREEAHAWVEHAGSVFPPHTDANEYAPLAAFGKAT